MPLHAMQAKEPCYLISSETNTNPSSVPNISDNNTPMVACADETKNSSIRRYCSCKTSLADAILHDCDAATSHLSTALTVDVSNPNFETECNGQFAMNLSPPEVRSEASPRAENGNRSYTASPFADLVDLNSNSSTSSPRFNSNKNAQRATEDVPSARWDPPVPSLRHRFALHVFSASPSPELTLSASPRGLTEYTDNAGITNSQNVLSTSANMENCKYGLFNGAVDNSNLEAELSATEQTSFLSPVPSGTVKSEFPNNGHSTARREVTETSIAIGSGSFTLADHGETGASDDICLSVNVNAVLDSTVTTTANRELTMNSTIIRPLSNNGTERPDAIQCNESVVGCGVPNTVEEKQMLEDQPILVSKTSDPQSSLRIESEDLVLEPDDNFLKWDYAGDLASRNLSTDSADRKLAMDRGVVHCSDRASDGKESVEGDVTTVPLTWPSPHDLHRSSRVRCALADRNLQSRRPFGTGDVSNRHFLPIRKMKGFSSRAISHGSFVSSPDPEELEEGVLTLPLGKLISDSGNMYSLRSESSLAPMMMGDGLDELESDDELSQDRSVSQNQDSPTNDEVPPQSLTQMTASETHSPTSQKSNRDLVNLDDYLPSSYGTSLDNIDQVCLTTSQSMLKLRRHADRVLEATEAAERRLRERLCWLSNTVSGASNEAKKTQCQSKVPAPEPRVRSSRISADCDDHHETEAKRSEQKESIDQAVNENSGHSSAPADGSIHDGLLNSPSWTSASEDVVVNGCKARSTPANLPRLPLSLSSGDENDSYTPTAVFSKNSNPVAVPAGTTHRTMSPPFTEPTVFSCMTNVTPLVHTPGRTGGFGDVEWDSKRSSVVDEHQDGFGEDRGPQSLITVDRPCDQVSRQRRNTIRSFTSALSWNHIPTSLPVAVSTGRGDVVCEAQTVHGISAVPGGQIRSWREIIKTGQPNFFDTNNRSACSPSVRLTKQSNYTSADGLHLLGRHSSDGFGNRSMEIHASTLSLPVCERDIHHKLASVPYDCFLSNPLEKQPYHSADGVADRAQSPYGDRLSNWFANSPSPSRYCVQPQATHASVQLNHPMASSTRLNSFEWTLPTGRNITHFEDLIDQERGSPLSVTNRPPPSHRTAVRMKPNSLNESVERGGYRFEHEKNDKNKSSLVSSRSSSGRVSGRQVTCGTYTHRQSGRTHDKSEQPNEGRPNGSLQSGHCGRSVIGDRSTSKAGQLVASQLRYVLLKHRLKLARAKDAYLLRRRVVNQLELLLQKVSSVRSMTPSEPMPADWDTDTSSLVTELVEESSSNMSPCRQSLHEGLSRADHLLEERAPPVPRNASSSRTRDSQQKRNPLNQLHIIEPSGSNGDRHPVHDSKDSDSDKSVDPNHGVREKIVLCDSSNRVGMVCQSRGRNSSSERSATNIAVVRAKNNAQFRSPSNLQSDTCGAQNRRELYDLRNRAEKQLAQMITMMKRNSKARSRSRDKETQSKSRTLEPPPPPPAPSFMTWAVDVTKDPYTNVSRNVDSKQYMDHSVSDARASQGGITWFQQFETVPTRLRRVNPVSHTEQSIKVIRESPRDTSNNVHPNASSGDTFFVEGIQTFKTMTHAIPSSSTFDKESKESALMVHPEQRVFAVPNVTLGKLGEMPVDDLAAATNVSAETAQGQTNWPCAEKSADSSNFPSEIEDEETDTYLSGIVATPRGIKYTISHDPHRAPGSTYRVMSARSEVEVSSRPATQEIRDLSMDLQTLFKQRMSHWISRCQERQKRIHLAAFERRYNKAIHAERAKLFIPSRNPSSSRTEATRTPISTGRDLASCNGGCRSARNSTDCHSVLSRKSCHSAYVTRTAPARGSNVRPCSSIVDIKTNRSRRGNGVSQRRVRPPIPSDQQQRALEAKLAQLRTNRLRMKIYGEKVLRSVLQRRAPWSVPFKEI